MVHDDEIDGSYSPIEFTDRRFSNGSARSDAHIRAILSVVDEHPDWKELPHDVLDELRLTRHDITLDTVRYALVNLESLRSRLR